MRNGRSTNWYVMALSIASCSALAAVYAVRPDWAAALTAWPAWIWPVPVVAGLMLLRYFMTRRAGVFLLFMWLLFLAVFADEPWSLIRGVLPHGVSGGQVIRVVSINCLGGDADAANEVVRLKPDIVLLQESPDKRSIERLAAKLFGRNAAVVWGADTSVLARGKLIASAPNERCMSLARVRLSSGQEVAIASVRLTPPVVRFDLWSPSAWREYTINRRSHRQELLGVISGLGGVSESVPLIVGGDMNSPQGDAAFRGLSPRLRDACREAGVGWGDTVLNSMPVLRFDQIWISKNLRARTVFSQRTEHSDHRMVVGDLLVR